VKLEPHATKSSEPNQYKSQNIGKGKRGGQCEQGRRAIFGTEKSLNFQQPARTEATDGRERGEERMKGSFPDPQGDSNDKIEGGILKTPQYIRRPALH